ncbi:hypothetical protein HDU92_003193 [Lobulomyces angularis]|nr:hypothetical protein HDU92_003193 [Lobulomyces angularis]
MSRFSQLVILFAAVLAVLANPVVQKNVATIHFNADYTSSIDAPNGELRSSYNIAIAYDLLRAPLKDCPHYSTHGADTWGVSVSWVFNSDWKNLQRRQIAYTPAPGADQVYIKPLIENVQAGDLEIYFTCGSTGGSGMKFISKQRWGRIIKKRTLKELLLLQETGYSSDGIKFTGKKRTLNRLIAKKQGHSINNRSFQFFTSSLVEKNTKTSFKKKKDKTFFEMFFFKFQHLFKTWTNKFLFSNPSTTKFFKSSILLPSATSADTSKEIIPSQQTKNTLDVKDCEISITSNNVEDINISKDSLCLKKEIELQGLIDNFASQDSPSNTKIEDTKKKNPRARLFRKNNSAIDTPTVAYWRHKGAVFNGYNYEILSRQLLTNLVHDLLGLTYNCDRSKPLPSSLPKYLRSPKDDFQFKEKLKILKKFYDGYILRYSGEIDFYITTNRKLCHVTPILSEKLCILNKSKTFKDALDSLRDIKLFDSVSLQEPMYSLDTEEFSPKYLRNIFEITLIDMCQKKLQQLELQMAILYLQSLSELDLVKFKQKTYEKKDWVRDCQDFVINNFGFVGFCTPSKETGFVIDDISSFSDIFPCIGALHDRGRFLHFYHQNMKSTDHDDQVNYYLGKEENVDQEELNTKVLDTFQNNLDPKSKKVGRKTRTVSKIKELELVHMENINQQKVDDTLNNISNKLKLLKNKPLKLKYRGIEFNRP